MVRGRCDRCLYWDNSTTDDNGDSPCRVQPPRITIPGYSQGVWPFTSDSDWCGAFVADPDKAEDEGDD